MIRKRHTKQLSLIESEHLVDGVIENEPLNRPIPKSPYYIVASALVNLCRLRDLSRELMPSISGGIISSTAHTRLVAGCGDRNKFTGHHREMMDDMNRLFQPMTKKIRRQ